MMGRVKRLIRRGMSALGNKIQGLIGAVIGIVVFMTVFTALYPTIESSASNLKAEATNATNTYVKSLATSGFIDVIPFIIFVSVLVGLIMLGLKIKAE